MDISFDEIASWFPTGLTAWMKRNLRDKWDEFLALEKELNKASFDMDEGRAQELLIKYRAFVKDMADEFESRRNTKRKNGRSRSYAD